MKLAVHDIDWKSCRKTVRNRPFELGLIRRAELATQRLDPFVLTTSFMERALPVFGKAVRATLDGRYTDALFHEIFPMLPENVDARIVQLEHSSPHGEAQHSVLHVMRDRFTIFALPTGGFMQMDVKNSDYFIPDAFSKGEPAEATARYGSNIHWAIAMFTFFEDLPEIIVTTPKPKRRVVHKGRSVRQNSYRIVSIHPGAERTVTERAAQAVTGHKNRAKTAQHPVKGHWMHLRTDPDCPHAWVPLPDIDKRRETCLHCTGRRTLRAAFLRGDPNVARRKKIIVVQ